MKTIWEKDYAMIFWASKDKDPIDTILKVNNFLHQYGNDYFLDYLNEDTKIEMSKETLARRVKDRQEKGSPISQSYFSSNHIWFSCSTGVKKFFEESANFQTKFLPETLKFEFDLKHFQGKNPVISLTMLRELFEFCLDLWDPFYGRIQKNGEVNDPTFSYREIANKIILSKVPVAIEWFNYFNAEWVENLGGLDKVLAAPVWHVELVEKSGGVILILQNTPFDYRDSNHLQKRRVVEDYFNLRQLHQLFRK